MSSTIDKRLAARLVALETKQNGPQWQPYIIIIDDETPIPPGSEVIDIAPPEPEKDRTYARP